MQGNIKYMYSLEIVIVARSLVNLQFDIYKKREERTENEKESKIKIRKELSRGKKERKMIEKSKTEKNFIRIVQPFAERHNRES